MMRLIKLLIASLAVSISSAFAKPHCSDGDTTGPERRRCFAWFERNRECCRTGDELNLRQSSQLGNHPSGGMLRIAAGIMVALLWAAPSAQAQQIVQFGPYRAEKMQIFLPARKSSPTPAVSFWHGGGWRYLGFDDHLCPYFLAAGIACFVPDYRPMLWPITPTDPNTPASLFPAQREDVQFWVRYMKANAAQWNVDPNEIGIMGGSAGGYDALDVWEQPATWEDPLSDPLSEGRMLVDQSSNPAFVVDLSGPTDLTAFAKINSYYASLTNEWVSAIPVLSLVAKLVVASPIANVRPTETPLLIMQGIGCPACSPPIRADLVISMATQVLPFRAALNAYGITYSYAEYPGGHAFTGLTDDQLRSYMGDVAVWILRIVHRSSQ
jgi:acetyl esterase/lipase